MKQLRLRPFIGDHDLQRKVAWARDVLESGEQVRVAVRLRGRENARPELGRQIIERVVEALDDVASTGTMSHQGNSWSALLIPAKRRGAE